MAVAVTGVAAGIQGVRFSRMEPEGAIPMEDGSEPGAGASRGESRAKWRLNLLGAAHLASALSLAGINAAVSRAGLGPRSAEAASSSPLSNLAGPQLALVWLIEGAGRSHCQGRARAAADGARRAVPEEAEIQALSAATTAWR